MNSDEFNIRYEVLKAKTEQLDSALEIHKQETKSYFTASIAVSIVTTLIIIALKFVNV